MHWYTCDCSSHTWGMGGCGWHQVLTMSSHSLPHHQTLLSLPSFNNHSTCPGLRPQHNSPHLSLEIVWLVCCYLVHWKPIIVIVVLRCVSFCQCIRLEYVSHTFFFQREMCELFALYVFVLCSAIIQQVVEKLKLEAIAWYSPSLPLEIVWLAHCQLVYWQKPTIVDCV